MRGRGRIGGSSHRINFGIHPRALDIVRSLEHILVRYLLVDRLVGCTHMLLTLEVLDLSCRPMEARVDPLRDGEWIKLFLEFSRLFRL